LEVPLGSLPSPNVALALTIQASNFADYPTLLCCRMGQFRDS